MRTMTYDHLTELRTGELRGLLMLALSGRTRSMIRFALRERGRL